MESASGWRVWSETENHQTGWWDEKGSASEEYRVQDFQHGHWEICGAGNNLSDYGKT